MREAAQLFDILPGTIANALKRDPEAWCIALRAGRDRRKPRQRSILVELAADAVRDDGLSIRDAAASYGVEVYTLYRALRRDSLRRRGGGVR
jgi:transposase